MAKCAYQSCGAEASTAGGSGYCDTCGGSMQACRRCGAFNRSLARYCRSCSAPFEYKTLLPDVYASAIKKWPAPDNQILTQERFWLAPIAYGGWLWFLSAEGQLSKYSPFTGSLTPVVHLGQEYGCSAPLDRIEMPTGGKWSQPGVVAISPDAITAVGMIDGRQMKVALDQGEVAVADFTKEPCGVAGGNKEAYFLTRRDERLSLAIANLETGRIEKRFEIPESQAGGPLFCGGEVFVYSETRVHSISGNQLKSQSLPAGFRASVQARDSALRQAFGRMPFMVKEQAFYIPGRQGNRPVFLLQKPGRGPAIIPVPGETTFIQDDSGRPVLALEGSVSVLEDSVARMVREDGQLSAMCPAFACNGTVVGMAEPSPSALRLRIYVADAVADFFVQRESFRESVGVYALGNSLSFCATLKDTTIGIYSWIC
jgi:hypothetical protein